MEFSFFFQQYLTPVDELVKRNKRRRTTFIISLGPLQFIPFGYSHAVTVIDGDEVNILHKRGKPFSASAVIRCNRYCRLFARERMIKVNAEYEMTLRRDDRSYRAYQFFIDPLINILYYGSAGMVATDQLSDFSDFE